MKKLLFLLILVFASFYKQSLKAQTPAGASMTADLSYNWVGSDSLMITYKYYRDCRSAAGIPVTVNLWYEAPNCNAGGTITLTKAGEMLGQPYCQVGSCTTQINQKQTIYTGLLVLPASCSNWELAITNGTRMGDNLAASGTNYLYTNLVINNTGGIKNMLPLFPMGQIINTCPSLSFAHSNSNLDMEGDSLVYSLVAPLTGPNTPVVYAPGYSASAPLGAGSSLTAGPFANYNVNLNSTFPANTTLAFTIKIKEYRLINSSMQLIGEVNKDVLLVVRNCQNPWCSPVLTSSLQHINTTFEIPADTTTCLDFTLQHNCDTAAYILRYDTVQAHSGAIIYYNGNQVRFCWRPDVSKVSGYPYQFGIIKTLIPKCGPGGAQFETIYVRVLPPVITGLPASETDNTEVSAFPNPFSKNVTFTIKSSKRKQDQEIVILNLLGQEVERITVNSLTAGENSVNWQGGSKLAPGAYMARLEGENKDQSVTIRFIKLP